MKRSLFICVLSAQLLLSCLAEQDNPLLAGSCTDQKKNQDETGVDCGGSCPQCPPPLTVPCQDGLRDNVILIDGYARTLKPGDYTFTTKPGYFEIYIKSSTSSENVTIQISGSSLPTDVTKYPLASSLSPGRATIKYYNYYTAYSINGELYVRYANQKWYIEVCQSELTNYTFSWDYSGRIIYQP